MSKQNRRRLTALCVFGVALAAGYYIACAMVARMLDVKLREMVSANLNAELKLGGLRYHFPYGVSVSDASLMAGRLEVLHIGRLELQLAELPGNSRPLIVEKLIVTDPSVHLMRTSRGIFGMQALLKQRPHRPDKKRLSEIFRLRRFAIEGGSVEYDDPGRPGAEPVVWKGLNLDLSTTPQSDSMYAYDLKVDDQPLAQLVAAGTFDIDALTLVVKQIGLDLQVTPDARESKLPGVLQAMLRENQIRGGLKITGELRVPLKDPGETKFKAVIDLPRVTAKVPKWDAALDRLALRVRLDNGMGALDGATSEPTTEPATQSASGPTSQPTSEPTTQPTEPWRNGRSIYLAIELFDAVSGDTSLHLDKGALRIDPLDRTWRARKLLGSVVLGERHDSLPKPVQELLEHLGCRGRLEMTGAANGPLAVAAGERWVDAVSYEVMAVPREFSMHPAKLPQAIEKIGGSIRLLPGLLLFQNMEGQYGGDKLFVVGARLPLAGVGREVHINELNGSIDFGTKAPVYPKPLGEIFEAVRPGGLYTVTGSFVIHPKELENLEYKLDIASDHGRLTPGPFRIPMTELKCDITAAGKGGEGVAKVSDLKAKMLGGAAAASGMLTLGKPATYEGQLKVTGADLRELAVLLAEEGKPPGKLSGIAYVQAQFSGTGGSGERTVADNFRANGEFEVVDGDYWEVPVLKAILRSVKASKEAATVGQGAGTFEIRDQVINLTEAAVSAPILGVEGSGKVGFDGQLDLRVIAVPLADWNEKIKKTGIPIVSDAIGAIAGGIQKLLNDATSSLLYEFRVRGTIARPEVTTIPVPILSDATAGLFGKMRAPAKNAHLLDSLRQK